MTMRDRQNYESETSATTDGGSSRAGGGKTTRDLPSHSPAPSAQPEVQRTPGDERIDLSPFALHMPVQRKGAGSDDAQVHAHADAGFAGAAQTLPHADAIQASFGSAHDVSGIEAHVGGPASHAADAIGASAYAMGSRVAFAAAPDLHTAAHEAAHVVQQRAGVSLKGGVGQAGDPYELHADAVADRVVRGESAAHLLSAGSGGAAAVQRKAKPRKQATVHVDLGDTHYSIADGKLHGADDTELGTIAEGDHLASDLGATAPRALTFTPADGVSAPPAGNLLASAPEGSRLAVGAKVWIKSEGEWGQLTGKQSKGKGEFGGFVKYGGGSVRDRLTEMAAAGQLSLSGDQIAVLAAVANVETGGQIGCVQTYDDQVMSVGFKQVVLGHGSLEKMMHEAPAGFAKHGLTLDASQTYPKQSGWSKAPHQIVGCDDVQELRQPAWAMKFYQASMEPDVVAALCRLLLVEQGKVNAAIDATAGANGDRFDDLTAQAWLLELYNNRPAYMAKAVQRAAGATGDRDAFLDALAAAIIETYVVEEPLLFYNRAKAKAQRKGQVLTPAEDAELLAHAQEKYVEIGRKKGTNIVTKIPRTLSAGDGAAVATRQPTATPAAPKVAAPAPKLTATAPVASAADDESWWPWSTPDDKAAASAPQASWAWWTDETATASATPATTATGTATAAQTASAMKDVGANVVDAFAGIFGAVVDPFTSGDSKPATPAAPAAKDAPKTPAAITQGDADDLTDTTLRDIAARSTDPKVKEVAADLAGLVAASQKLRASKKKMNGAEEAGTDRDDFVANVGAVRGKLAAVAGEPQFKAAAYRLIASIGTYYAQSRNIDILESPPADQTRTCNITSLAMALEGLGKDATMYTGSKEAVQAAAKMYAHKITGDDKSNAAVDAVGGRGVSWGELTGMRLPDFMELAAIAKFMPTNDDDGIKAGAKSAWDKILSIYTLEALGEQFGAKGTVKTFDATGTKADKKTKTKRDVDVLGGFGDDHRLGVEKYINARNKAEASGNAKDQAAAEKLKGKYDEAMNDTSIDERLSIDTYREYIVETIGADLAAGGSIVIALTGHYAKLQSIHDDHLIVNDPARDSRAAQRLTYAEARAMGYLKHRLVLS